MQPTIRPLLKAKLTVSKTVHFVSTLEFYEAPTATPPSGVEVDELPPSVPGLVKTKPPCLQLVRKSA